MDDISRLEYERWLRENNVPDYKRALYNDDPRLVMSAFRRDQELAKKRREEEAAEKARLAEAEREKSGQAARNPGLYGDHRSNDTSTYVPGDDQGEDTAYIEEDDYDADDDEAEAAENDAPASKTPLYGYPEEGAATRGRNAGAQGAAAKIKKKKKKTGKKERIGKLILAAAVAVLVVLIIGISIVNSIDFGTYKLGYITIGEVIEQGAATAYFVRNSESLFSSSDGIFKATVAEGDRIEAGGTVGYIVREDDKGVLSRLEQVNRDILKLMELVNGTDSSEPDEKLVEIDAKIAVQRARLSEMGRTGNISECGDVENIINSLIAERNAIRLEAVNGSDSILSLKREKEDLEKIVNEKMVPVVSEKAGIVSFNISDSENVENDLFQSFEKKDGSARLSSLSLLDNNGRYSKVDLEVSSGEKVCKVICDQNYYVILKITKSVSSLKGILTVKSGDLKYQAAGQISEESYMPEGYAIMSTMRGLRNCLDKKSLEVTYDVSKSSGYCVPLTALSDWDKSNTTARLAVVKAGYVSFVYVGIKAFDSEKAIITSTPFEDAPVLYPDGSTSADDKETTITAGTCYVIDSSKVHDGQKIS